MAVVMVIDDDPEVRGLLESIVQKGGHEVIAAADASNAWMRLDRNPEAFFVDIDMPGETGIEFVLRLRAHPDFAASPLVFVTAFRERARPLFSSGGQNIGIIDKPFRVEQIEGALETMLKIAGGDTSAAAALPSAG